MPGVQTIYVELPDEAVPCWRPVDAVHLRGDLYEIPATTLVPTGERWAFTPGQTVRCSERAFDPPGTRGFVAIESVETWRPEALEPPLSISRDAVAAFCRRWSVQSLSLFGSVLRSDFGPTSDIDILARFRADAHPTLFTIAEMKDELEALFHRPIDLVDQGSVEQSDNIVRRRRILESARMLYAA